MTEDPTLLGLSLSTHRPRELGPEETTYFQYEAAVAAVSILFFRLTVRRRSEPRTIRFFFGILLAILAYMKKSYELIVAVELFSYATSWLVLSQPSLMLFGTFMAASAAISLLISHSLVSGKAGQILSLLTPKLVMRVLHYLFPIEEFQSAYSIMEAFADPDVLWKQVGHLFFVTFHIQVGMGFMGIDFLTQEQDRRNQLIRLDVEKDSAAGNGASAKDKTSPALARAHRFQRGAAPFILFTAMPYMIRIIGFGNTNKFAFTCVQHDMHRTVRLNKLFDDNSNLAAMAANSATSPDGKCIAHCSCCFCECQPT